MQMQHRTFRFGMKGNNVKKCKENSQQFLATADMTTKESSLWSENFSLNKSKMNKEHNGKRNQNKFAI